MLLTSSFAALLCIGIMNGVGHASNMKFLGEDVSPLLSFLTLPFFELTIRRKHEIFLVMRIIVFAAIVMAAGYMTIIISLLLQIVSVGTLYGWITLNGGEDFVFEGETGRFFYKGVIFICIAIIFLAFQNRRRCKVIAGILLLTLFFVGSRDLFLALALCCSSLRIDRTDVCREENQHFLHCHPGSGNCSSAAVFLRRR